MTILNIDEDQARDLATEILHSHAAGSPSSVETGAVVRAAAYFTGIRYGSPAYRSRVMSIHEKAAELNPVRHPHAMAHRWEVAVAAEEFARWLLDLRQREAS